MRKDIIIKNIFEDGELQRDSVIANFATTATDGKKYHVDYYNLLVVICLKHCQLQKSL